VDELPVTDLRPAETLSALAQMEDGMRTWFMFSVLALAIVALAGCSATDNLPTSSLTIRDTLTDYLLSTPDITGSLQLTVGQTKQVKVLRTYTNSDNQTETDDVTQFTNFKWESGSSFAAFDQLGNFTGLAAGSAIVEAKFRATAFEPWDHCKLMIVVSAP
jgi:hypothetical protein